MTEYPQFLRHPKMTSSISLNLSARGQVTKLTALKTKADDWGGLGWLKFQKVESIRSIVL